MAQGGTWSVTGDSSLKQLTLEDGATITAPAGCTLTFYTGCDASNALDFYDETGAEAMDALEAGTYENVVIRLSGTPISETTEAETEAPESAVESFEPVPTPEPVPDSSEVPEESPEVSEAPAEADPIPVLPVVIVLAVLAVVVVAAVMLRRKKTGE